MIMTYIYLPVYRATAIIFIIIIILGNSLVLIACWMNKILVKEGKCYLASLAVADLLVGSIVIPIRLYEVFNVEALPYQLSLCIGRLCFDIALSSASITTITVIAIDRYYKISRPIRYKAKVTTKLCTLVIACIWLYAALVAMFGVLPYNDQTKILSTMQGCKNPNMSYHMFSFTMGFAVPCVVLAITYALIFLAAHRRRRRWINQNETTNASEQSMLSKDLKNAKTLGIIILSFVICWGTFLILLTFRSYFSSLNDICNVSHPWLCFLIDFFLPQANSCCNPFIYALGDREFRSTFKNIFRKSCRQQVLPVN